MEAVEETSVKEIVQLAAVDHDFYGRYFFPKAYRQATPKFHEDIDKLLWGENRHVAIKVFRGGAKTTKLRVFTSKRIAYGISHTIVFVSKSQDHAVRSIEWIKKNVEFNRKWADIFQLRPGAKWTGEDIEILHRVDEYPIRIVGIGITGQTRGINFDDFRPDLIIVDDPCDEENTATPEQRQKIEARFFGALEKSLAPESEAPHAMMALLQTPLDADDLIEKCMKDAQWASAEYSCFDENGESAWPQRWSTETLRRDKQAHIDRNQLSLWLREMEVTVVSAESAFFKKEWLQFWEVLPDGMTVYLGIDPTPPPKENSLVVNKKLDDSVIVAIGLHRGKVYVLEYYTCKSPNPDEFIAKIFEFYIKYRPLKVGFESLLFARTTKFYLEKEMQKRQIFFPVTPVEDRRAKRLRIHQAINGRASQRMLYVHRSHTALQEQFIAYPNVRHDDILDALSIALDMIVPMLEDDNDFIEAEYTRIEREERSIPELEWRSAV